MEASASRKKNGQFPKGVSGNPKGRPRKKLRESHARSTVNRRAIAEAAQTSVPLTINGEATEMSLYRANLIAVGMRGLAGSNTAARIFLTEVRKAAEANGHLNDLSRWALTELDGAYNEIDRLNATSAPTHGVYVVPNDHFARGGQPPAAGD